MNNASQSTCVSLRSREVHQRGGPKIKLIGCAKFADCHFLPISPPRRLHLLAEEPTTEGRSAMQEPPTLRTKFKGRSLLVCQICGELTLTAQVTQVPHTACPNQRHVHLQAAPGGAYPERFRPQAVRHHPDGGGAANRKTASGRKLPQHCN